LLIVELTSSFTEEQKTLVLRYLGEAERFSPAEWVTLLEAFTTLESAMLHLGEEKLTFQAFYDRFIDQVHCDRLIADLFAEMDIAAHAPAIQARYARQIWQQ
jgi:hypothetical protein